MGRAMAHYVPHSPEWFDALESANPEQANATRQILTATGRSDVCSVCGDVPAKDYKIKDVQLGLGIDATIRLCGDCLSIRSTMHGESFEELGV